jgi:hypothetical protein
VSKVLLIEPVTSRNGVDLSTAAEFGEIHYLCDGLNPYNLAQTGDIILEGLIRYQFNPKHDLICLSGHPLALSILMAIVGRNYDRVKVLCFDKKRNEFLERFFSSGRYTIPTIAKAS